MAYDIRKLIDKGLVRKFPARHRYVLTPIGDRAALSVMTLYERALSPVLTPLESARPRWGQSYDPLHGALAPISQDFDHLLEVANIAA